MAVRFSLRSASTLNYISQTLWNRKILSKTLNCSNKIYSNINSKNIISSAQRCIHTTSISCKKKKANSYKQNPIKESLEDIDEENILSDPEFENLRIDKDIIGEKF
ncbi:unnamed protein product [Meganyctiphanes norvegica]|uniref:Uncharacterized protein n=1 Tax=Meganyctiphanes norvegica TaxID=48144 RepID=A0AAV2RGH4_MEGNR